MKNLREALRRGDTVYGQFILDLFSPGTGAMLDACGLDWVLFDMEHGRCDITLLAEMMASCRGLNIAPLARVPDVAYAPLSRVLDVGARGVMVPRVETRAQAEDIVAQLKYAPAGKRGVALGVAHDLYRAGPADFFATCNDDILVIVQLETAKGFENLDEILSVPGIDVAWLGLYDLSVSFGTPMQWDHPRLLAATEQFLACCRHNGIVPGVIVSSPDEAAIWKEKGFRMISLGVDISLYTGAIKHFRQQIIDYSKTR